MSIVPKAWIGRLLALLAGACAALSLAHAESGTSFEPYDPALAALEEAFEAAEAEHGFDSPEVAAVVPRLFSALMLRAEYLRALVLTDRILAMRDATPNAGAAVDAVFAQLEQMRATVRQNIDICAPVAPQRVSDPGREMRIIPQGTSGRPLDFEPRVSRDGASLLDISRSWVIVRDIASGMAVHRFTAGQRQIRQAAWVGDGRLVIHTDSCISLWDVEAERHLATVAAPAMGPLISVLGTPDGKRLVTVYGAVEGIQHGSYALVWRITPQGLVREYFLDGGWPAFLSLMPDYQVFLSHQGKMLNVSDFIGWHAWPIGVDEKMRAGGRIEWLHSNLLKAAGAGEGELVKGVAIAPDATTVAITTRGADQLNRLRVLSLSGGEAAVYELDSNTFPLIPRYSPDGHAILIGNDEIRRPGNGEKLGVQGNCTETDWMPDGRLLCLALSEITLLDLDSGVASYIGDPGSIATWAGDIRFSPDGRSLFAGGGGLVKWDIASLYPDPYLAGGGHDSLFFDGDYLVSAFGNDINRYDWKRWGRGGTDFIDGRAGWSGSARTQLDAGGSNPALYLELRLSPDRKYFVAADDAGRVHVLDAASGQYWRDVGVEHTRVSAIAVSPDSRYIATAHDYGPEDERNGEIRVWRVGDGKPVKTIPGIGGERITALRYAGKNNRLLALTLAGIRAFDVGTGKVVSYLEKHYDWASAIEVAADGRTLYVGHVSPRGPRIATVDLGTGRETASYVAQDRVKAIDVAPDGRLLAASLDDGTIQLWNTAREHATVQLARGYMDWVVYTPDGYYASSRSGTRLVAGVVGGKPVGLDQLALRFNRPDIILERMGLGSPEMIRHYRLRHAARLRKAGVSEGADLDPGALPRVTITDIRQQGNHAQIRFSIASTGAALGGYRLQVNGVPVVTRKQLEGAPRELTETVGVDLVYGRNLIELVAVNALGLESLGERRLLLSDVAVRGDLYFIGFGVSKYRDSRLNLKYADKDVLDLERLFRLSDQFAEVHTRSFVNESVNAEAMQQVSTLLQDSKADDTVVVFIAGHGMHDSDQEGTYYYLSHEADPRDLASTAVPFSSIEGMLSGIPARRKLLLIDTCESGELDPATAAARFDSAAKQGIRPRTVRGLRLNTGKMTKAGPRPYLTQRDRYLYNDLSQRTGAVIFASALGHEFAYEDDKVKNGFFTEAIIRTLTTSVDFAPPPGVQGDRFSQFARKVKEEVVKLSKGKQNPTVDRSNIHADIRIDPVPAFFMESIE